MWSSVHAHRLKPPSVILHNLICARQVHPLITLLSTQMDPFKLRFHLGQSYEPKVPMKPRALMPPFHLTLVEPNSPF
jgi:hypothetical protein